MLVDTHAHLTSKRLKADARGALERARAAGVERVVTVGIDAADSAEAVELAGRHEGVYAAVGIHPHEAAEVTDRDWEAVAELACAKGVIAVGETGLDFYRRLAPAEAQEELLRRHLELARELALPAIVHSRSAEGRALEIVREFPGVKCVFHCFTGPAQVAQAAAGAGHFVGFTGVVTYRNADEVRRAAAAAGAGRIVVETDCPYMVPEPLRSDGVKRSEPAHVRLVGRALAATLGMAEAEVERATTDAARDLFGPGVVAPGAK
jgi:TatD DNase family protein